MDNADTTEAIDAAVADMRRLHELAVRGDDLPQEGTRLRQAIYRRWLGLDAGGRLRLQRAQQEWLAECLGTRQ